VEMSDQIPQSDPTPLLPIANAQLEENFAADDSGHAIIAMLHKAAGTAKEDCARAMDLAHKLSFDLRTVEERARAAEAEAARFRDRAAQAEAWLLRILNEIERAFFRNNQKEPPEPAAPPSPYAPPYVREGRSNGGKKKEID
jgi:hypothetical protein